VNRTWLRRFCLLVALHSFGLRASPPQIEFTPAFGVNVHIHSLKPGDLVHIRDAGFTWVRTDLMWAGVERKKGNFDFKSFDTFVRELQNHHLKAIVILDYGNPLYANAGDTSPYLSLVHTQEFRRAYATFCAAAVAHYSGLGFIWEQWNEPNNKHAWAPTPDSDNYVALMKAAAIEIRKKCPDEVLMGPASSQVDLPFIEACLQGGMLEYWSAISVHPYRAGEPEKAAKDYAELRAQIARYLPPNRSVPIVCGEWGYSTAWKRIDDLTQADYLARMFQLSRQENIPLTIWYDWRDDGDNPKEQEHRFGLIRRSPTGAFDPKPAYFAARKALTATSPESP
jgi:polysaccharide biosynthesis protein PslG